MSGSKPILSSARLRMRAPEATDASRLAELAADYDIACMTTRMPHPYGLEDAIGFIDRSAEEDPRTDVTFVLEDAVDGPIGALGFFTDGGPGPEIGYWIGRPYWGRGYATEAVQTALAWADGDWGKRLTLARHFTDNPASARVLEKAGYLPTGVSETRWSVARGAAAPTRRLIRLA
jgi:RimJ/RimL family protein N-acetyltransferase